MMKRLPCAAPVPRRQLHGCAKAPGLRRPCRPLQARGGMGDDDLDVAVFRFTLGIPGFDDALIPRIVGMVGAATLAFNHMISPQPVPLTQGRAELLCGALALLLVVVPDIEERLREAQPGRGRQQTSDKIEGSTNVFALATMLDEKQKQELAWASFSLLKNTNSCGVIVLREEGAVMARGALGSNVVTAGQANETLSAIHKDVMQNMSNPEVSKLFKRGPPNQLWFPDRGAMSGAGIASWSSLPSGAQSVLLQRIVTAGGGGAMVVLFSERPRALAEREIKWAAAMATKLSAFL